MNQKQIEEHRAIYPLPEDKLCRYSSFKQILGTNKSEYSLTERKRRWEKVMKLDVEMAKYRSSTEACEGCRYLTSDAWCNNFSLPCTVNPITTFKNGIMGMACMGLCYENKQITLFK